MHRFSRRAAPEFACIFLDTNLEVGYIAADFRLRVAWEASEIVTALTPSDFKP